MTVRNTNAERFSLERKLRKIVVFLEKKEKRKKKNSSKRKLDFSRV